MFYAYLDENNIVKRVLELPCNVNLIGFISIASNDTSLIGKYYDGVDFVALKLPSDQRVKKDITPADTDRLINFINNIKVKDYMYKLDNERHTGVIAQELMLNDPEYAKQYISRNITGMYSVSFSELVFPLIVAVQELTKRVAKLEKEG